MIFTHHPLGLFALIVLATLSLGRAGLALRRRSKAAARGRARTVVRIGGYRVLRKLGEGGMGVVYEALDAKSGERVAVKLVRGAQTPKRLSRFESEIRILERVRHPNLVALRAHGATAGGARFFAMELLDGVDLQHVLDEQGPLRPRRVASILRDVGEALVAVHDAGFVHRDIKPANVLSCRGRSGFVKLLDFGLATAALHGAGTEGGDEIVGSPYNMAPECFTNPDGVGPSADLYALGVLAHTLLTGAPPFAGGGLIDIAAQHLYAEPPSLLERCPSASPELRALVASCLEKTAERRPPSARALLRALSACPEARASARHSGVRGGRSLPARRAQCRHVERAAAA
jgi:serine/threonine-protein kinase